MRPVRSHTKSDAAYKFRLESINLCLDLLLLAVVDGFVRLARSVLCGSLLDGDFRGRLSGTVGRRGRLGLLANAVGGRRFGSGCSHYGAERGGVRRRLRMGSRSERTSGARILVGGDAIPNVRTERHRRDRLRPVTWRSTILYSAKIKDIRSFPSLL